MTQLPNNNNPLKEPAASAAAGPDARKRTSGWLSQHLKSVFIGGLLALIPLFVTIYILRLLFLAATGFFYPTVQDWLGNVQVQHWTHIHNATAIAVMAAFVSLLVFLGVVYLIGVLGSFVIGRQLLNAFDHRRSHTMVVPPLLRLACAIGRAAAHFGVFEGEPVGFGSAGRGQNHFLPVFFPARRVRGRASQR